MYESYTYACTVRTTLPVKSVQLQVYDSYKQKGIATPITSSRKYQSVFRFANDFAFTQIAFNQILGVTKATLFVSFHPTSHIKRKLNQTTHSYEL